MLNRDNDITLSTEARDAALGLASFIEKCPSMFHTTAEISARLKDAGFLFLPEVELMSLLIK